MSHETPNIPHVKHTGSSKLFRAMPALVWLGACVVVVWLFTSGGSYDQLNGLVDFKLESVASLDNGKVAHVYVKVILASRRAILKFRWIRLCWMRKLRHFGRLFP